MTRREKAKLTRERKKFYKKMNNVRTKVISKYFPEHINHPIIQVDTEYIENNFMNEKLLCDCGNILSIEKEMFDGEANESI